MRTEITESDPESKQAEQFDRASESSGLTAALDELGLDKDYLVNECGCMERKILTDEGKLDQFLVLKAILDKNMPKLLYIDITILQNIV